MGLAGLWMGSASLSMDFSFLFDLLRRAANYIEKDHINHDL